METIRNCIILCTKSPVAYQYIRRSGMFILPSKETLRSYMGRSSGEVGVTALVKERLKEELKDLNEFGKRCSLQIDEMSFKPGMVAIC